MPRFLVRGLSNSTLKRWKNIPPMTVMKFVDSLRAMLHTNQPQASVAIKYDIVNIINFRINNLNNCQANRHVISEYLTVQHIEGGLGWCSG
jgi:hypothetical protein